MTVLSPELSPTCRDLVDGGLVEWLAEPYVSAHLDGFALVVASTSDKALNVAIAEDAKAHGILCCVASSGRLSQVVFPAVCEEDGMAVAVHSHGRDCRRSKRLRDALAATLHRFNGGSIRTLGVVSVKRSDVSPGVFRRLSEIRDQCNEMNSDGVVLATCWRWEYYFLSDAPRATAAAIGDLISSVSDQPCRQHVRTGPRAHHHLLRVLCGLDSPMPGETEIVGQVRQSIAGSCGDLAEEVFASALLSQRDIRRQANLMPCADGWADAIVRRTLGMMTDTSRAALVIGLGKIGTEVAERLAEGGIEVKAFSRRAVANRTNDAGKMAVMPTNLLGEHLDAASVVVVCSELRPDLMAVMANRLGREDFAVIDVEGGHEALRPAATCGRYVGSGEMLLRLTGTRVAAMAAAEKLAIEHSLAWFTFRHIPLRFGDTIRLVGRASRLSGVQLEEATRFLEALDPGISISTSTLATPGDRNRLTPLPEVTEDDFFTRDIDEAILAGKADLAVHSAKDLPDCLPDGLCVAALLPSILEWECLVSRDGMTLEELPDGATIGTSSHRRRDGLKALRPDLQPCDVRGDVPDRIAQMDAGKYDGLLLAAVGLVRLGLQDRISEALPPWVLAPAMGQGSLALVCRRDDVELRRFLEILDLGGGGDLSWR